MTVKLDLGWTSCGSSIPTMPTTYCDGSPTECNGRRKKINHALVLGGLPGIGKDSILEPVKTAIGPWNFIEVSPSDFFEPFNGYVKSVILRISEARDLGDVSRYDFYERMKTYSAAPPCARHAIVITCSTPS